MKLQNRTIKFIIVVTLSKFFFACSNNELKKEEKNYDKHFGETRFTFSQKFNVDFMISGGEALVLYDYSKPIDTLFNYSGAQLIGKDSIIYVRIKRSTDVPDQENDFYFGNCVGLYLFDGIRSSKIVLNDFDPYFSSFIVQNRNLYYWGINKEQGDLYAVKYSIDSKKYIKKSLSHLLETDQYAYLKVPRIEGNKIYFETEVYKKELVPNVKVFYTANMQQIEK
jgi:hypothetical protein